MGLERSMLGDLLLLPAEEGFAARCEGAHHRYGLGVIGVQESPELLVRKDISWLILFFGLGQQL
jgi:hypothetical protein